MCADEIFAPAHEVHFSTLVFDTHVDTAQRLFFDHYDLRPRDAEGSVDIPRLLEGGVGAIFLALWVPVEITGAAATKRAQDLLNAVLNQIELHGNELALATSPREIQTARSAKKIAVLLGVEGGHVIDNDVAVLRDFHSRGVRYMTLTHNAATDWADSSNDAPRHQGLTDFGKQVIHEMNRLGMLVDVSHVSDRTFYDVLETSRAPVIASHSCCRALCNSPRNLDDAMIKRLGAAGGVIHITFHVGFLSQEYANSYRAIASEIAASEQAVHDKHGENEAQNLLALQRLSEAFTRAGKLPQVSWEKIVEHIDHAVGIAGADHVGVGSDFDGAFMPAGLEDASQFPRLTEGMLRRGYREADICKILGENTLRVMAGAQQAGQALHAEKS